MAEELLYSPRSIFSYKAGQTETRDALIVIEKPLTVFLNHNELATLICSPGGFQELTVGFLISEGILKNRSSIVDIRSREDDGLIWIETSEPVPQTGSFLRRHIASCCGKGRAGLYFINDARELRPVISEWQIHSETIINLMASFEERANSFRLTGGLHSAALADEAGIIVHFEDIGRHNAVDKSLGYAFLNELSTNNKCLLLSGRVASEILIKAARSNIPIIISRAAPTDLTLELAEELNICVVGFARSESFNIYTHPEKIVVNN